MSHDDFAVVIGQDGEHVTVHVTGDVDLETSPALTEALRAVSDTGAKLVRLDLSGVTFLDSTGIGALVNAMLAGLHLEITAASRSVNRALELAGIPELPPRPG